MDNKYIQRCSTLLIIKEMLIQTIMNITSYPLGWLVSKKQKLASADEGVEKVGSLVHC